MGKIIIIVDDSSSLRSVVKMALSAEGHTVIEAGDGADALSKLDGRAVDMIISDLNMPRMNGLDFAKAAKAISFYRFTPILMLTTETSDEKKAIGKAAGLSGWMPKPFSSSSLINAVNKLAK